jgi:hypothetical protein
LEIGEPSEHSLVETGKPRKTCVEVAGRRIFRILTSSQQSGISSKNSNTHIVQQIHIRYNKYIQDKQIQVRQIQLTKMRIRKTKKLMHIVSNIFPTTLHTRFYPSPSIFTNLPPIYTPPIAPPFTHSIRCTSLHFSSLHFTTLFDTLR